MDQTRREFLRTTLGTSALLSFVPAVPAFLARAATINTAGHEAGDRILVVIQLTGGNDGLNTVVPYEDDAYARSRPTLRLEPPEVHALGSSLGLHPRMTGFKELYDAGHLSIIHGVGHAGSSRSHGPALRAWHTARPDQSQCQTGWLGRFADQIWNPEDGVSPALGVTPIQRPLVLDAERARVPAIRSTRQLATQRVPGHPGNRLPGREALEQPRGKSANFLLQQIRRSSLKACADTIRLEALADARDNRAAYPSLALATDLRAIAQLVRAELGTRVFFTELGGGGIGGFDNHAGQRGNHCALLAQLSESVAAFVRDLKQDSLLDRVLLMTFSEFGRTLKENGRRGTGHGAAAPVFLAGGRLAGGCLGRHPSLTDLDNGAPRPHTDFRRVYATVLDGWLGFDSKQILGATYEPLDVLTG